jgi:hypothetical protein
MLPKALHSANILLHDDTFASIFLRIFSGGPHPTLLPYLLHLACLQAQLFLSLRAYTSRPCSLSRDHQSSSYSFLDGIPKSRPKLAA